MKYTKLLYFTFFFAGSLFLIGNKQAYSQTVNSNEAFEDMYSHWFSGLSKFKLSSGLNKKDYGTFRRFSQKEIDSVRGNFIQKIGKGEITPVNVKDYEDVLAEALKLVYKKFERIKQLYPSSVEEYNTQKTFLLQTCQSACTNIDFETGNLSSWYAYSGCRADTADDSLYYVSGGYAGAVTLAANDTLTSTSGFYNTSVGPNPRPDYQVKITSGSQGDRLVPSIPQVSPFGGKYSVMIGDSTLPNYGGAMLSQSFLVGTSNANFTYQYAVFLENPTNPLHPYHVQPFFKVTVYDSSGGIIPYCGDYFVVSQGGIPGFKSIYYAPSNDSVYYKNWTMVNVPLKHYIGQCVTVVFEVGDCGYGGHFGYAYVDASCSPLDIISSSEVFCGQDSIALTGPAGASEYKWTGPAGGIVSNDTLREIYVVDTGIYTVVTTPFTGSTCNDTLTIHIGQNLGTAPPKPKFSADTVCVGNPTAFINSSNPLSGATFYWDFYNVGTYQDSSTNPTWIYNLPGTYTVKLHEVYNGCGIDTLIHVVVDSIVTTSFISDTICYLDTLKFVNTSTGATSFNWNFGDPPSGVNNTSVKVDPGHSFSAPGTYTVSLIGKNAGGCNDTVKHAVVVLPLANKPTITGLNDSICYGSSTVLTAGGGTSYKWNTGATTSSITINPTVTTTYSVAFSNIRCPNDTSFTVYVKPKLVGTLTGTNVCLYDTIHLTATGGGTYLWNNGATTSSLSVTAISMSDTAFSVTISNSHGQCLTIDKKITVYPLPNKPVITGTDSVCYGSSVVLDASGASSYIWNTGQTTSSITVEPTTSTTYTVSTSNTYGCKSDTTFKVNLKPVLSGTLTGSPYTCLNQPINLTATGGGTYLWSNGATTSSISVLPTSVNDTAYSVTISNGASCITIDKSIIIYPLPVDTVCCSDTITPGSSVVLNGGGGVSYYWIPPTGLSCDTCPNPTASPTTTTVYTLVTVSNQGCKSYGGILTIAVEIPCNDFFVPNVYTPNGDGKNDTYLIKADYMSAYQIQIYNRWGQEVFHSDTPYPPWDGDVDNTDGRPAPSGVYYYFIRATCFDGNFFEKHGFVQLIR